MQRNSDMLGAIAGDIIGSVYEDAPIKREDFPLWHPRSAPTDDTVLALAVADAAMGDRDYSGALRRWAARHPHAGYGPGFSRWMQGHAGAYGSLGNGAAMRAPAIGWLFDDEEIVLEEARASALPTHDHPEGVRGAQAVALAVYLARRQIAREDLRLRLAAGFGYNLHRRLQQVRAEYRFDATCPGSVPEALIAFLESESVEDAIRKAVSLGGDADTQACIAGAIAEAYYGGVPEHLEHGLRDRLPADLTAVLDRFLQQRHGPGVPKVD